MIRLRSDLADSHSNIGILFRQIGKPAEALASYRAAADIQQALADANPAITEFQGGLAHCRFLIGTVLRETGRAAEGAHVAISGAGDQAGTGRRRPPIDLLPARIGEESPRSRNSLETHCEAQRGSRVMDGSAGPSCSG